MRVTQTDGAGRVLEGSVGLDAYGAFLTKQYMYITPWSPECFGVDFMVIDNGFASGTVTQNTLYAVPLQLDTDFVVKRVFWGNGTVVNGNADVGVFNWAANSKIVSAGNTAQANVSVLQSVDVTDTTLSGGQRYWMVFGMDSATGTYVRAQTSAAALGYFPGQNNQAGGYSSGLPSSLTLAAPATTALPLFGICGYTVS